MFLTLPTLLTWGPIVAIPLIVGVFYLDVISQAERNPRHGAVRRCCTDGLARRLPARKLNQTSSFGAFLDPVADKFLVCSSLLILLNSVGSTPCGAGDRGREIAISALREWMAQIGASRSVAVHMVGKLKTTVQMVAIPFLLF